MNDVEREQIEALGREVGAAAPSGVHADTRELLRGGRPLVESSFRWPEDREPAASRTAVPRFWEGSAALPEPSSVPPPAAVWSGYFDRAASAAVDHLEPALLDRPVACSVECVELDRSERRMWMLVAGLLFVAGVTVGLVAAFVLQPDRVLIPVDRPVPTVHDPARPIQDGLTA